MSIIGIFGIRNSEYRIDIVSIRNIIHMRSHAISWLMPLFVSIFIHSTLPDAIAVVSQEEKLFTVGIKAYQDGLYDLALQEFQRLEKKYPQSSKIPIAQFFLGEIFLQKRENNKAAKNMGRWSMLVNPLLTISMLCTGLVNSSSRKTGMIKPASICKN